MVELDDWEFDVELPGPAKRILRAGAAAYLLADSIRRARGQACRQPAQRGVGGTPVRELTASVTVDDLIAAYLSESVEYVTRHHPAS